MYMYIVHGLSTYMYVHLQVYMYSRNVSCLFSQGPFSGKVVSRVPYEDISKLASDPSTETH